MLWYKQLKNIAGLEKIVTIKQNALDDATKGKCLTISKSQNIQTLSGNSVSQTWFTIKSVDCTKPHQTICKLENIEENVVSHEPPPQFPCISTSDSRRKREVKGWPNSEGTLIRVTS